MTTIDHTPYTRLQKISNNRLQFISLFTQKHMRFKYKYIQIAMVFRWRSQKGEAKCNKNQKEEK